MAFCSPIEKFQSNMWRDFNPPSNSASYQSNNVFARWVRTHKMQKDGIRLGQRFVNDFIKGQWPELFYQSDDKKAINMIWDWLKRHHYYNNLPRKTKQ